MDAASPAAFQREGKTLRLSGRLDTAAAARLWRPLTEAAKDAEALDLSGLIHLDTTGATLVLQAAAHGARIEGAGPRIATVLRRVQAALAAPAPPPPPPPRSP
ncbi:MAG: STAS domain-containing protein, partial [Acetobacteraceae bacterium]|nr:STAS domain-containing protein [Acetobacteraceae bacterium]